MDIPVNDIGVSLYIGFKESIRQALRVLSSNQGCRGLRDLRGVPDDLKEFQDLSSSEVYAFCSFTTVGYKSQACLMYLHERIALYHEFDISEILRRSFHASTEDAIEYLVGKHNAGDICVDYRRFLGRHQTTLRVPNPNGGKTLHLEVV
jgi:hypothetical protein